MDLPDETEACASVTSAFLQVQALWRLSCLHSNSLLAHGLMSCEMSTASQVTQAATHESAAAGPGHSVCCGAAQDQRSTQRPGGEGLSHWPLLCAASLPPVAQVSVSLAANMCWVPADAVQQHPAHQGGGALQRDPQVGNLCLFGCASNYCYIPSGPTRVWRCHWLELSSGCQDQRAAIQCPQEWMGSQHRKQRSCSAAPLLQSLEGLSKCPLSARQRRK